MPITTSAPGKLMLFGEHAVIQQHPCLVTAVDLRVQVTLEKADPAIIVIDTPHLQEQGQSFSLALAELFNDALVHPQIKFVITAIRKVFTRYNIQQGLTMRTNGPVNSFGLGSSSAVTVATVFGLMKLFNIDVDKSQIFDLAYSAVLEVQEVGSGFDVACAIYGGTLFYQRSQKVETIQIGKLPLVIGYSGAKVSTTNLVQEVEELRTQYPAIVDQIFKAIGNIASTARIAILQNNWQTVGQLANINQGLLESLGVSTDSLDQPIRVARKSGALGAKLSGAGGGDCMFAFVEENRRAIVEKAIEKSGAQVLRLATNTEGVRVESDRA
jgi:mevalonate kinase